MGTNEGTNFSNRQIPYGFVVVLAQELRIKKQDLTNLGTVNRNGLPSRYRENAGGVVIPIPATTPPKHNLSAPACAIFEDRRVAHDATKGGCSVATCVRRKACS